MVNENYNEHMSWKDPLILLKPLYNQYNHDNYFFPFTLFT